MIFSLIILCILFYGRIYIFLYVYFSWCLKKGFYILIRWTEIYISNFFNLDVDTESFRNTVFEGKEIVTPLSLLFSSVSKTGTIGRRLKQCSTNLKYIKFWTFLRKLLLLRFKHLIRGYLGVTNSGPWKRDKHQPKSPDVRQMSIVFILQQSSTYYNCLDSR